VGKLADLLLFVKILLIFEGWYRRAAADVVELCKF
jgi:hypothetical protein